VTTKLCTHATGFLDGCRWCRMERHRASEATKRQEELWKAVEAKATAPRQGAEAGRTVPLEMAAPECVHRGRPLREAPCKLCGGRQGTTEVRACAVHGECTFERGRSSEGVRRCQDCDTPKTSLPREFAPGLIDPIQESVVARDPGWAWRPDVRDRHVTALREVVRLTEGVEAPERDGRGILLVGGGKYWPGVVIACTLARELGYDGRILVWHRGKSEPIDAKQVEGLGVEVTDADAYAESLPPHLRPRSLDGWSQKTFAVMNCGLAEAFYLDADAYPVADPTPLFSLLSNAPFCFWVDHSPHNVWGPYHGLAPERVQAVPAVQSGQMLIDVRRHWRPLTVARWIDDHSPEYFCPRNSEPREFWHQFGDQDSHRVALAYTGSTYHAVDRAEWRNPPGVFTYRHEGRAVIVHRSESKMIPGVRPRRDDTLPLESRAFELFARLA